VVSLGVRAAGLAMFVTLLGCAPPVYVSNQRVDVSKFRTATPADEEALAFPRECDANRMSADPSLWLRLKCFRTASLPKECEPPGTYRLFSCQIWLVVEQSPTGLTSEQLVQQSVDATQATPAFNPFTPFFNSLH
jgi:hypothetical protein